jgi:hypothetical protein
MLTIQDIHELAKRHNIEFRARYDTSANDLTPPKPEYISLWFTEESVDAWRELMTKPTEVPVRLNGTRQVSGNGAIDGRLFDGYKAILGEVNAARAEIGLDRVFA